MNLLDYLDDNWRRALGNVKAAAAVIWLHPIHTYYTDHTISHSERIISILSGLTEGLNELHPEARLTKFEIYILLAAAYLHDIGMQSRTWSKSDDLEIIREIHHETTFQMILHSGDQTDEYPDCGLINDPNLIPHIAWVAKSHRRVNLKTELDRQCTHQDGIIRPQFLAALLRLADALDIDNRRVVMEELKLSPLPVKSLYHWYRCYFISGVRIQSQGIIVSYKFPPGSTYADLIVPSVQAEIKQAIDEVRDILWENKVNLVLLEPECGTGEKHKRMPNAVETHAAKEARNHLERSTMALVKGLGMRELVPEVEFWFDLLDYDLGAATVREGIAVDWTAKRRRGLESQPTLVRCIYGEIGVNHVQDFGMELASANVATGFLISERRIAPSAEVLIPTNQRMRVLTLPQLINEIFRPYYDYLDAVVKNDGVDLYYVDLACERPVEADSALVCDRDSYPSIDKYVDSWLQEASGHQVCVLGEYGSGKTWFCRHYAWRHLETFKSDPCKVRLPLLIRLRDYPSFGSIRELITDFLLNQCKLTLPRAFDAFERLNSSGRLLLLFDGLDEMGTQVDEQVTARHLDELFHTLCDRSKVVLTSRKEYFVSEHQASALLNRPLSESGEVQSSFELLYLLEFDISRMKKVLRKRVPQQWKVYWQTIKKIYDLPDLAKRPVMLDMIIRVHEDLQKRRRIDHASLYEICTNQWIEKDISEKRTLLNKESKRYFAQEVAWEMFGKGEMAIPFTRIKDLVWTYLKGESTALSRIEFLEHDIQTAGFIGKRDESGYYEFAHKSFLEFFAAQKLARAVASRTVHPFQKREIYYEIIRFFCQMIDPERDIPTLISWMGNRQLNEKVRANSIRISRQWIRQDDLANL